MEYSWLDWETPEKSDANGYVDERDTGIYSHLTSEWAKIMIAGGYDTSIEALIKLRRLEPKHKLVLDPKYSEEAKGALRSLVGLSQALYEVGAATALPHLEGLYLQLDLHAGPEEKDIIGLVHTCLTGQNYPVEFRSRVLKAGSSLARSVMNLKDAEIVQIDDEIKKSPLYPLMYQVVHLAYQYKHPKIILSGDKKLVVCVPGGVEPPMADFVNVTYLVLDDADKIQLDRNKDEESVFDFGAKD